jgi:hypothetical protein
MNFIDFEDYFWAYISENTVPLIDRQLENKDFCDAICYDCYRTFKNSNVNIDTICKLAEDMLFNVNRYKPIFST